MAGRKSVGFWSRPTLVGALIALVVLTAAARTVDLHSPPRFDGAGYSVLALSLSRGQGYREIDHPDAPRHAHFPPGYPLTLAIIWKVVGRPSASSAHVASVAFTLAATMLTWRWFRTIHEAKVAGPLGLALALNWTWQRMSGEIQSEPLYLMLQAMALLACGWVQQRGGLIPGVCLGVLMASCVMTRQVGVALAAALGMVLISRGAIRTALAAWASLMLLTLPWLAWLFVVRNHTQVALLGSTPGGLLSLVKSQLWFYTLRIPDQITGPFVEVGTVFSGSRALALIAGGWAILATSLIAWGWVRCSRAGRRAVVAFVPLINIGLLLAWPFTEAGRFLVPLVPFLLLGATEGLGALIGSTRFRLVRARPLAALLLLITTIPYPAYSLLRNRAEAQRRTQDTFDAACRFLRSADRPGPVMTRHPGEVFWQTGRLALAPSHNEPENLSREARARKIAYFLVDDERYAHSPENPLARFAAVEGPRLREVWSTGSGATTARILAFDSPP